MQALLNKITSKLHEIILGVKICKLSDETVLLKDIFSVLHKVKEILIHKALHFLITSTSNYSR